MIACKKCGAENQEWQEKCYKCGTYLTDVKLDLFTRICLLLSVIVALYLSISQVVLFVITIGKTNLMTKIVWVAYVIVLTIAEIQTVMFLKKRMKKQIRVIAIMWILYVLIMCVFNGSPIFAFITIIPYTIAFFRLIPIMKKLN